MAWFKVDDGFANSKPVLRIPRRYRAQAVGLWTLAGTWCAKEETDGFVPDYVLEECCGTTAIAKQLVTCGLWEEVEGGYQFVGWAKYNPTKEQLTARRSEEAERKQAARNAAAEKRQAAQTGSRPQNVRPDTSRSPQNVRGASALPDPTRPDPTPYRVTKGGGVTSVDANQPPPCSKHPENSDQPCAACRKRRLWEESEAERLAADELYARRVAKERAENCPVCHGTNVIEIGDNRVRKCDHAAVSHG